MQHRALWISLALHLAAGALVSLAPATPGAAPPRPPLQITLLQPTPVQRQPVKPQEAPRVIRRKPSERGAAKNNEPPAAKTETPLPPKAEPTAKTTLVLPSFLPTEATRPEAPPKQTPVTRGSTEPGSEKSEAERVQSTLAGISKEWTTTTNAKSADGRTTQIGRSLQNAFRANKKQMNDDSPHPVMVIFEQWQREMAANTGPGTESGTQTATSNRRRGEGKEGGVGLDPTPFNLCFGACSSASHEVTRIQTLIEIDHDSLGAPARWRIEHSSGRKQFDETALESVQLALGCMKDGTHHVLFCKPLAQSHGPVPQHSVWALTGIVYRWSNFERLLDPHFTPSGTKISQGPFAGHYLDSSVRLVELAYWERPASLPKAN